MSKTNSYPDLEDNVCSLSGPIFTKIVKFLDGGKLWENLATLASDPDWFDGLFPCGKYETYAQPTKHLICDLGDRGCTVEVLVVMLQELGLYQALLTLIPPEPMQITQEPFREEKDWVVIRNDPLQLCCAASGVPPPTFQWMKDGHLLDTKDAELTILNFQDTHVGTYVCQIRQVLDADTDPSVYHTKPIYVRLEDEVPCILQHPKHHDLYQGEPLVLECKAIGYPTLQYQWYRDSAIIPDAIDAFYKVTEVCFKDSGEYWCCVWNALATVLSDSAVVTATFYNNNGPPCIIEEPALPVRGDECMVWGAKIFLECKAKGKLPLSYQWYKDGKSVACAENPELIAVLEPGRNNNVVEFRCVVSNSLGSVESQTVRVVLTAPLRSGLHYATGKFALVIANYDYEYLQPLKCPLEDARCLTESLQELDFKVLALTNLNLTEMRNAIYYFSRLILQGSYAVIYYVGHGYGIYGKDYLLPIDAPPTTHFIRADSIDKEEIVARLQQKNPALILVLLDMCRKQPSRAKNPNIYEEKPRMYNYVQRGNTAFGYATSEHLDSYELSDETNGIYMKYLIPHIKKRVPVRDLLAWVQKDLSQERSEAVYLQKPMSSDNLANVLSLADKIYRDDEDWTNYDQAWLEILKLPQLSQRVFYLGDSVSCEISFAPLMNCFVNNLIITIMVRNLPPRNFLKLECHPKTLQPEPEFCDNNKNVVCIYGLQRLTSCATLLLYLVDRRGTCSVDPLCIELGVPLIARALLCVNNPQLPSLDETADD